MGIEQKRDTDRVPILGELHGEVKVYAPISIKEISRGGAQVETTFPLQVDSLHEFRLTLGERSVVLKGRIAHCHISDVEQELVTYRAGLEFIELSDRAQTAIVEFMEAIKAGRRA
jgi:PilZ domain-containing protein